ncbi:MAG: PAS domain S-box protein [Smithellaceae bacterium]|nr:PAS domain S-box protein [Smithellaceae bacterium]
MVDKELIFGGEGIFQTLFEQHLEGMLVINDYHFVECNTAALQMMACTKDEIIGRHPADLSPPFQPDGSPSLEKANELMDRALSGERLRFEWILRRGKDEFFPVEVLLGAVEKEKRKFLFIVWKDIAEIKQAEVKLRELEFTINESPAVALLLAAEKGWPLLFVSENVRNLGYTPEDLTSGRVSLISLAHPDDRQKIIDGMRAYSQRKDVHEGFVESFRVITRNGETRWVDGHVWARSDAAGRITHYQAIVLDITERKQLEDLYRTMINQSQVGFYISRDGKLLYTNPYIQSRLGYSAEEMEGSPIRAFVHPDDVERGYKLAVQMLKGRRVTPYEYRLLAKDGHEVWVLESISSISYEGRRAVLGCMIDISEQKEAERRLGEMEDYESSLLHAIPHAVIGLENRKIIFANDAAEKVFGWRPGELIGQSVRVLYRSDEEFEAISSVYKELAVRTTFGLDREFPCRHRDGHDIYCRISASRIGATMVERRVVATYEDLTRRREAEERVRRNENLLRNIMNVIPVGLWITDDHGVIMDSNRAGREIWGGAKYIGLEKYGQYKGWWGDTGRRVAAEKWAAARALKKGETSLREVVDIETFDGKRKTIFNSAIPLLDAGRITGAIVVNEDITEIKKIQRLLSESEQRYRALFENAGDAIFILDTKGRKNTAGRIIAANRAAALMHGYSIDELLKMRIRDLDAPNERDKLTGRIERIMAGEWIKEEIFHLRKNGTIFPVEITAGLLEYGGQKHILAIDRDITERIQTAEQLKKSFGSLRKAVEDIVSAMAGTIETRDPYTAGHQQRVAKLAQAVAEEMGLPTEQVEGVRVAALIHDIGKLHVPAEILSKPSHLSHPEQEMVKTHPQAGYDILKDISFQWPVALAVLQHHERLNGSGYPFGLLGGEIILEAKVLAVADIVEAMASHRPYRPSLGLVTALDEIATNRGILYDAAVVDACLRLFVENRFHFDQT